MSNIFTDIGHDVKVGAEDVAKDVVKVVKYAIVDPVEFTAKLIAVLNSVIKDEPEVKTVVEGLIQQFNAVDTDVVKDIGEKGLSLPDDLATAQAIEALFTYFKDSFVPVIESAYKDIDADATATN